MTDPASRPLQATPDVPRNPDGTIKKGYSLNPNGRPKSFASQIREATKGGDSIWRRMLAIWDGTEAGFGGRERLEAGKWLKDNGWGRTPETQIQLQGELGDVEGAAELASDALLDLAGDLSADTDPVGGSIGGIDSVTHETH